MRLIKLTSSGEGPVYIAPGAVCAVKPWYEFVQNELDVQNPKKVEHTLVYVGDMCFQVQESLATVMNALYYKNDGGHQFGQTPFKEIET
jgi:hypothetical protein